MFQILRGLCQPRLWNPQEGAVVVALQMFSKFPPFQEAVLLGRFLLHLFYALFISTFRLDEIDPNVLRIALILFSTSLGTLLPALSAASVYFRDFSDAKLDLDYGL